jgi:hypothetical protein
MIFLSFSRNMQVQYHISLLRKKKARRCNNPLSFSKKKKHSLHKTMIPHATSPYRLYLLFHPCTLANKGPEVRTLIKAECFTYNFERTCSLMAMDHPLSAHQFKLERKRLVLQWPPAAKLATARLPSAPQAHHVNAAPCLVVLQTPTTACQPQRMVLLDLRVWQTQLCTPLLCDHFVLLAKQSTGMMYVPLARGGNLRHASWGAKQFVFLRNNCSRRSPWCPEGHTCALRE